jgi:uncharacterized membrane protein
MMQVSRVAMLIVLLILFLPAHAQELPRWSYEVEGMYQTLPPGALDTSKVKVADASGGIAVCGDEKFAFNYWHNYTVMQPGEYVATFRLKISDNTKTAQVIQAYVENGEASLGLRADQFKAPNAWQEFTVPFTLKKRALVSTPVSSRMVPGVTVWADKIVVMTTRVYGDDEQLRLLNLPRRTAYILPAAVTGVWLGRGVYHEYWRVPDVAPFIGGALASGAVHTTQAEEHLRNFPATFEELVKFRVVVLANVPAGALTVEQRAMLEDFVRAGGGLIVLGGPYSFGAGDYHTSDIFTRLLPVTSAGKYDIVKCAPPQPLKAAGPETLAADLLANNPSVVLYRHKLAAKVGATVQVKAGEQPLIVTGAYGKGRVVAVLATPLGPNPAVGTPWWQSTLWPQIMVRLLAWAAGQ